MVTMFEQLHNIVTQANETTPVHNKRTECQKRNNAANMKLKFYIYNTWCVLEGFRCGCYYYV
jgi:hypothetical protein